MAKRERVATGDLFAPVEYPPTIDEARLLGAVAQQQVEEHANEQWLAAASLWIARLPAGARFVSGDVWIAVEATGLRTTNRKAVGPVIARAAKQGLIERSGLAACRTSHGSLRAEWTRR